MKTDIVINILPPTPYLAKFWITNYAQMLFANQLAGFFKM